MNFLKQYTTRNQLNALSSGRSMIEMLGVLAIIGVLSVAGIAGYGKAMEKFKINKTIDQITTVVSNIVILFANEKEIAYLDACYLDGHQEIVESQILPQDMIVDTNCNWKHALGGKFNILFAMLQSNPNSFELEIQDLSREACIQIASYNYSSLYGMAINNSNSPRVVASDCEIVEEQESSVESGALIYCRNSSTMSYPLSPANISKACNCTSATCYIQLLFAF